jgi:hypothetical protein
VGGAGAAPGAGGESDEIELSLGLSLGGCFGAEPSQEGRSADPRLQRSSSVASICSLPAATTGTSCGAQDAGPAAAPPPDLLRTSSLPAEYMEDRLRRRAMQSQRRLEAKRKRLERRNSMSSGRPVPAAGGRDDGLEHTVPSGFQLRRSVALTTAGSPTPSRPPQQGMQRGNMFITV